MIPLRETKVEPVIPTPEAAANERAGLPSTRNEAYSAMWDAAVNEWPTTWLSRNEAISVTEYRDRASPKIDPEELNKRFPGAGFSEPKTLMTAQAIYDQIQESRHLEELKQQKQDALGSVERFGAQLIMANLDPIMMTMMLATSGFSAVAPSVEAKFLSKFQSLKDISGFLTSKAATTAGRAAQVGLEAGAFMAAAEIPKLAANKNMLGDAHLGESMVNVGINAAGMAILHTTLAKGYGKFFDAESRSLSLDTQRSIDEANASFTRAIGEKAAENTALKLKLLDEAIAKTKIGANPVPDIKTAVYEGLQNPNNLKLKEVNPDLSKWLSSKFSPPEGGVPKMTLGKWISRIEKEHDYKLNDFMKRRVDEELVRAGYKPWFEKPEPMPVEISPSKLDIEPEVLQELGIKAEDFQFKKAADYKEEVVSAEEMLNKQKELGLLDKTVEAQLEEVRLNRAEDGKFREIFKAAANCLFESMGK